MVGEECRHLRLRIKKKKGVELMGNCEKHDNSGHVPFEYSEPKYVILHTTLIASDRYVVVFSHVNRSIDDRIAGGGIWLTQELKDPQWTFIQLLCKCGQFINLLSVSSDQSLMAVSSNPVLGYFYFMFVE